MFPYNQDSLLEREKELMKLNDRINQKSPKLFNKNEKAAITAKKVEKSTLKLEKFEIKTKEPGQSLSTAICSKASKHEADRKKIEMAKQKSSSLDAGKFPTKPDSYMLDNAVPKVLEKANLNKDNLIKFLKAKVAILQTELEAANKDNQKLNVAVTEINQQFKKSEIAYGSLKSENLNLQQTVQKLEQKVQEQSNTINNKEDRINVLSKEQARLSAEWSRLKKNNQALETRLFKTIEAHEITKSKLTAISTTEKEVRQMKRQECSSLETQVKELKKERIHMLNAFKKQLLQIEQLKKQNTCLDEERLIEIAEKEYMKLLEWSNNNQ